MQFVYVTDVLRKSKDNLFFLDETGFNEHSRCYGYSPININAYIVLTSSKSINRNILSTKSSLVAIAYSYRVGSYNSNYFINFIKDKLALYFVAEGILWS
ncbi:hypothetical protein H311_03567 [Anncaliia algerae PRA109]|nr:hypothetical protein H311_03567 [Anncaliia algerae PRA109]